MKMTFIIEKYHLIPVPHCVILSSLSLSSVLKVMKQIVELFAGHSSRNRKVKTIWSQGGGGCVQTRHDGSACVCILQHEFIGDSQHDSLYSRRLDSNVLTP